MDSAQVSTIQVAIIVWQPKTQNKQLPNLDPAPMVTTQVAATV